MQQEILDYRKTKHCPNCDKLIIKTSSYCGSCSQLGKLNRNYKDGHTSERKCKDCNKKISSGSQKGYCRDCYNFKRQLAALKIRQYSYNRRELSDWSKNIIERDNKCMECNNINDLHAHHIYPKAQYPELIFNMNNGITLCAKCHRSIKNKELQVADKFIEMIRPK